MTISYQKVAQGDSGEEGSLSYMGMGAYKDALCVGEYTWNVGMYGDNGGTYGMPNPYEAEDSPYKYNVYYDDAFNSSMNQMILAVNSDGNVVTSLMNTGLWGIDDEENEICYFLISMAEYEYEYVTGSYPGEEYKYGHFEDGVVEFGPGAMAVLMVNTEGMVLNGGVFNSSFKVALPGSEIKPEEDEVANIYIYGDAIGLSDRLNELKTVAKSANGTYSFDLEGMTNFTISTSNRTVDEFYTYMIGAGYISEAMLGKKINVGPSQDFMRVPWKGNYHFELSGDLSQITVTTTTPRPSSIDLYLVGEFNDWKFDNAYKFNRESAGQYALTVPSSLNGEWKIANPDWIYDYGYAGDFVTNPENIYELTFSGKNINGSLNEGDVLSISINEAVYFENPTLKIERSVSESVELPEDPASSELTINGIVYRTYPSVNSMAVVDASAAKGKVVLLESQNNLKLTTILSNAFADNAEVTSVEIPSTVTSIGERAFANCENLQNINLPASLLAIGDYAFLNCSYLSEMVLPAKLNSIGTGVFEGCTDMYTLDIASLTLTEIPASLARGCERLTEIVLPGSATSIAASAFEGTGIVSVSGTEQLTAIGSRAFADSKIETFKFGNGLSSIGMNAFEGTAIKTAKLPSSVTTLGAEAFKNCGVLSEITLPASLKELSDGLFENCSALHQFEIPAEVEKIGARALFNTGIVTIVVPDKVTSLGESSLAASSLMSVTLGSGITSLAKQLISTTGMLRLNSAEPPLLDGKRLGCSPSVVIVPKGSASSYKSNTRWKEYNIVEENGKVANITVTTPGTLAQEIRMQSGAMPAEVTNLSVRGLLNDLDFAVMKSNMTSCYDLDLSRITNTEIADNAFKGKVSLTKVTLPENLVKIGDNAFAGCRLITLAALPSTLEEIGDGAFTDCSSLAGNLILPASVKTIGKAAFANCFGLASIDLSASSVSTIAEGVFENATGLDNVILPTTVKTIEVNAFKNATITEIEIPGSVKTIGASAFEGCIRLEGLELPSSVTSIAPRAFAESGVVYITLPETLSVVEEEILADCPDLLIVNLPSAMTEIGDRALASSSISAISSPSVEPASTGVNPFETIDNMTCGLSIPGESFAKYLGAQYWGSFVDVRNTIEVTIDGSADVTYIDEEDYQELISEDADRAPKKRVMTVLKKNNFAAANRGYSRLFDGARIYRADRSVTRFFVNVPQSVTEYKVVYNGEDVTSRIDASTNSFLAPEFTSNSQLRVLVDMSGLNGIDVIDNVENGNVYNLQGIKIAGSTDNLPAGIYIVNGKKIFIEK